MGCLGPDDYDTPSARTSVVQRQLEKVEAMLCGITHALEKVGAAYLNSILTDVDWKEAKVTRAEFLAWWVNHKEKDAKRRAAEDAQKLSQGIYKVRDTVNWQDREWIVKSAAIVNGEVMVTMVTFDDGPLRNVRVGVRK